MTEATLTLETSDGPMDAFLALPEGAGPHPALVVIQEAFGVTEQMKEVCRRLAKEGYAALAPELFHRQGRGILVSFDDMPGAMKQLGALDNAMLTADVEASLITLRARPEIDPKRVGIIGFCLGGFTAFLAACRTDVAASVVFYGGGLVHAREGMKLEPLLGEAKNIRAPLLGLFGGADRSIPPADLDALRGALEGLASSHEIDAYPDAPHGFFNEARKSYHARSAAEAWPRVLTFLRASLG